MNYQTLRNEILLSERAPAYAPFVVTNDMPPQNAYQKDKAIADLMNAPLGIRLVDNYVNSISLMAYLGAVTGAGILEKLDVAKSSNIVLKWAFSAIQSDRGINIGHHETQSLLDSLVPGVLTEQEVNSIKALGQATSSIAYDTIGEPVTPAHVSIALRFGKDFEGV